MTKQDYLKEVLRKSGMKGQIHSSLKELKHENGIHYAGILRCTDSPDRAKSRKTFADQEGSMAIRRKYFNMTTNYNVVIADQNEEKLEKLVESFLVNLGKGYDDGEQNWVGVEAGDVDWVDEDDSVLKSKLAVEIPVTFTYGIYRDISAEKLPGAPVINIGDE